MCDTPSAISCPGYCRVVDLAVIAHCAAAHAWAWPLTASDKFRRDRDRAAECCDVWHPEQIAQRASICRCGDFMNQTELAFPFGVSLAQAFDLDLNVGVGDGKHGGDPFRNDSRPRECSLGHVTILRSGRAAHSDWITGSRLPVWFGAGKRELRSSRNAQA